MDGIVISTERVVDVAEKIKSFNKEMNDEFQDLDKAFSRLDNAWNSATGTMVLNKFYSIKDAYQEARFGVMDNFSRFLLEQVAAGYEEAENINSKLADAFK